MPNTHTKNRAELSNKDSGVCSERCVSIDLPYPTHHIHDTQKPKYIHEPKILFRKRYTRAQKSLFCKNVGLFCRNTGLFCRNMRPFCRNIGLFVPFRALFCRNVGLLWDQSSQGNEAFLWSVDIQGSFAELQPVLVEAWGSFVEIWGSFGTMLLEVLGFSHGVPADVNAWLNKILNSQPYSHLTQ